MFDNLKKFCVTGTDIARIELPQIISPLGTAAVFVNPLSIHTTSDRIGRALRASVEVKTSSGADVQIEDWLSDPDNVRFFRKNALAEVIVDWENIPTTDGEGNIVAVPFDRAYVLDFLDSIGEEAVGKIAQDAESMVTFFSRKVTELEKKSDAGRNITSGTPDKNITSKPISRAARRNPTSRSGTSSTKTTKRK